MRGEERSSIESPVNDGMGEGGSDRKRMKSYGKKKKRERIDVQTGYITYILRRKN